MRVSNRSQNFLCCCTDFRAFSWSHLFPQLRQASVSSSGMFRRARGFSLWQREMPVCSSHSTHQTPHYTVFLCVYVCVCVSVRRGVKVNHKPRERSQPEEEEICEVVWDDRRTKANVWSTNGMRCKVFLIWKKKINHFRVFAQVQHH